MYDAPYETIGECVRGSRSVHIALARCDVLCSTSGYASVRMRIAVCSNDITRERAYDNMAVCKTMLPSSKPMTRTRSAYDTTRGCAYGTK
eukprot:1927672-Rhodomonas_salina.1